MILSLCSDSLCLIAFQASESRLRIGHSCSKQRDRRDTCISRWPSAASSNSELVRPTARSPAFLPGTARQRAACHHLDSARSARRGPGCPRGSGVKKPPTPSTLVHRPPGRPPGRPNGNPPGSAHTRPAQPRRNSEPSLTGNRGQQRSPPNDQAAEREARRLARERRANPAANLTPASSGSGEQRPHAHGTPDPAAGDAPAPVSPGGEQCPRNQNIPDPPPPYQELPENAPPATWTQRAIALLPPDPRDTLLPQRKAQLSAQHALQEAAQVSLSRLEIDAFALARMKERASLLMQNVPTGVVN